MTHMSHAEVQELLGAYALDAVEPDEAELISAHVEECPRCRDELANHREVAGMLAYSGQEAPKGLWDRVVAGIHDSSSSAAFAGPEPTAPNLAPVTVLGSRARSRWLTPGGRVVGALAAAAVVVVALLGVQVVRLQHRTDNLSGEVASMAGAPTMQSVRLAAAEPGARRVQLRSLSGGAQLEAVILPGGTGYLYDSSLSPLPSGETYQLWGVVGSERISYALMGATPAPVTEFRAGAGVQALAVTEEVAGGVEQSSHSPVVVGAVS